MRIRPGGKNSSICYTGVAITHFSPRTECGRDVFHLEPYPALPLRCPGTDSPGFGVAFCRVCFSTSQHRLERYDEISATVFLEARTRMVPTRCGIPSQAAG